MKVFCLDRFKQEVEKLRKKNSYASIEPDIIEHFFHKTITDVQNGIRLNGSNTNPYIKKRLEGRGGFRLYFLLIIKNDAIYLMFVHPKSGPHGMDNIPDALKKKLYKDVIIAIETNDLFSLSIAENGKELIFKPNTTVQG